jgi:GR25 family glycosyltransferase involved in LPS biosynthesis
MRRFDSRSIEWWFINLDHRTDRLAHIQKQCLKAGVTAQRFPALRYEDYAGPAANVANMMSTPKTIGNWLSHTSLWSKGSRPDSIVGVLEDDALLCEDFQNRLAYLDAHMTLDWDIFYLGATYHVNPPVWHAEDIGRDFELTGIKHIHRVYGAFSNQGYLINSAKVERLLELMHEVMPVSRGSDHAMIQLQPRLNCFSFTPGMVFQIDGQSDIGDGITRFSGFLESLGPHVWVNRLEDFDYDSYNWAEGKV